MTVREVGLPPADSQLSPELFVFARKKGVASVYGCLTSDLVTLDFRAKSNFQCGEFRCPTTKIYYNSFGCFENK